LGRRPTPNPRRGILRAVITVVVLTALLIIAILVVSTLSAPTVKAPSTPPTPGPITPVATPSKTAPSATPHAAPSPTHQKKSLGSILESRPAVQALEKSPSASLLERAAARNAGGIAVRSRNHVAWFSSPGNRSPFAALQVQVLPGGRWKTVGQADSLVKPVWSRDARYLLYVALSPSHSSVRPVWRLLRYDAQTGTSSWLATLPGTSMTPLGWWRGDPLFLAANGSDTSVYTVKAGGSHFIDVLAPQVITSAALSPRDAVIAFMAPTNCYNCTLELFSLSTGDTWSGPSGIADESLLAWSNDGRHILTMVNDRIVVMASSAGSRPRFEGPAPLPKTWRHSMSVSIERAGVRIVDRVTGHSIFAEFRAGTL
jgi:hypothetical protein